MILFKRHVERYTSHAGKYSLLLDKLRLQINNCFNEHACFYVFADGSPQCKIIVPLNLNENEFKEVLWGKIP